MTPREQTTNEYELSIDLRVNVQPTAIEAGYTDHLTGLHSRQWLTQALEAEIAQSPGGFSLLFIDLDGLKTINDRHGHAAGDSHIVNCAEALQKSLRHGDDNRPGDELAEGAVRLGGDEFVVLARGVASQEKLDLIKSRIRTNLETLGVSASIGGRPHDSNESGSQLLSAADELMYVEKRQRKQERIEALALHRKVAYFAGRSLLRYSGIDRWL
jgi:diguanylate cyclase (GGDEF)-like protein